MYEKDKILIKKAQEGDKNALSQILEENKGLIWSIVKRFIGRGYETEDIYQIACIGFIKAIKRFDISLGNELSTYSVQYMLGEVKKFFRDDGIIHISRNKKEEGLKLKIESIHDEVCKGKEKIEVLFLSDDEQAKIIDKLAISDLIKKLSFRDRQVINLRYFKDKTQMQVADILGISQVHVSRIEKRILKEFRRKLITL